MAIQLITSDEKSTINLDSASVVHSDEKTIKMLASVKDGGGDTGLKEGQWLIEFYL